MIADEEIAIRFTVFYGSGATASLDIADTSEMLLVIAGIKRAMNEGTVYTVNFSNRCWTTNGAHIISFEAVHPRMRELLEEWEKNNSARRLRRPLRWVRAR